MTYVGKKPADIIATAVDTTTGTFSGDLTVDTSTLYVDSANNRVGVGTVSPAAHLQVNGSSGNNTAIFTDRNGTSAVTINQYGNVTFANDVITSTLATDSIGTDMIFKQGASESMRLDSGNVVLNSSPSSTSDNISVRITGGTAGYSNVQFADADDVNVGMIQYNHSSNYMQFTTNDSERMRINSSGNVGIGTSSPFQFSSVQASLTLSGTSGSFATRAGALTFQSQDTTSTLCHIHARDGYMAFETGTSATSAERMRIDSSGNLLVGTTSINPADNNDASGSQLSSAGSIQASISNATPAIFNRGNDGAIIALLGSGVSRGSIGISNARPYMASNDSGLKFKNADITACTSTGADKDGSVSLGASGARFQNLYLSGGAYLGGTGSANLLDDYEEGTFTPIYQPQSGSFTSITYDRQIGRYMKIGKAVYIKGYIRTDALNVGSSSGAIFIGGLPFTSDSTTYNESLISCTYAIAWAGENPLGGYISPNLSVIRLFYRSTSQANASDTIPSDMGTGANNNALMFSGWYETTS